MNVKLNEEAEELIINHFMSAKGVKINKREARVFCKLSLDEGEEKGVVALKDMIELVEYKLDLEPIKVHAIYNEESTILMASKV